MDKQKSELKEKIKEIRDEPIKYEQKEAFINRDTEKLELVNILQVYEGGIIGVSGERGIGKTSLFNVIEPSQEKIIVHILNRESKIGIVLDIILALKEFVELKRNKIAKKKIENLIKKIYTAGHTRTIGMNYFLELKLSKTTEEKNFGSIIKDLKEILDILGEESPLVLILDEIDKEKKEEILLVIDAIKYAFTHKKVTLVIALPPSIYLEYLKAKQMNIEVHNLENVFDYIFLLHPLPDTIILKILHKFIDEKYISKDALNLITYYAEGNPRKAKTTLKEAGLIAILANANKIEKIHVIKVIKKYLEPYIKSNLTETEHKIVSFLFEGKRSEVVEKLSKKLKTTKQHIYKVLERLAEKGLIKTKENEIRVSRKANLIAELIPWEK